MSIFEMKHKSIQEGLDRLSQIHAQESRQKLIAISSLEKERAELRKELDGHRADKRLLMVHVSELQVSKVFFMATSILFLAYVIYDFVKGLI